MMANAANILKEGVTCLVDNLGVIDVEYFISLIKRDDFDYMVWQQEYYVKMVVSLRWKRPLMQRGLHILERPRYCEMKSLGVKISLYS